MKYIDAEKLKAEVKRIKNDYNSNSFVGGLVYLGKKETIDEFCSLIDSLQQEQPEIDLEAVIEREWNLFNKQLKQYDKEYEEVVLLNWFGFYNVARHFYELGSNTRKEDKK